MTFVKKFLYYLKEFGLLPAFIRIEVIIPYL